MRFNMLDKMIFSLFFLLILVYSYPIMANNLLLAHEQAHAQACIYMGGEPILTVNPERYTITCKDTMWTKELALSGAVNEGIGYQIKELFNLIFVITVILWGYISITWVERNDN